MTLASPPLPVPESVDSVVADTVGPDVVGAFGLTRDHFVTLPVRGLFRSYLRLLVKAELMALAMLTAVCRVVENQAAVGLLAPVPTVRLQIPRPG